MKIVQWISVVAFLGITQGLQGTVIVIPNGGPNAGIATGDPSYVSDDNSTCGIFWANLNYCQMPCQHIGTIHVNDSNGNPWYVYRHVKWDAHAPITQCLPHSGLTQAYRCRGRVQKKCATAKYYDGRACPWAGCESAILVAQMDVSSSQCIDSINFNPPG